MKTGTLVKYKDLSTPRMPCGHHIGHKYGMLGVVTGEYHLSKTGEVFYYVEWIDPPNGMEKAVYTKVRLEVLSE